MTPGNPLILDTRAGQTLGTSTSEPGEDRPLNHILLSLAFLAVITGALYYWFFPQHYQSDSPTYIVPSSNLLAGRGFTDAAGLPETNRPPGYPLFIMPFLLAHADLKYLVALQHLLRCGLVLAGSAFAFRLTGRRRIALLSGILMCLDLPLLESANAVLTEVLFTVLLTLVLYLLWRASRSSSNQLTLCLIGGIVSGATVLIRPVSLFFFLPAVTYLVIVIRTARMRAVVAFVLAFSFLPGAWAARNAYEVGQFTVSTISGFSMLEYRAAGVLAINDPGRFTPNFEKRRAQLNEQACAELEQLWHRSDCSQVPVAEKSKYFARLGRRIVSQHPAAYLKLAVRGAILLMLDGGTDTLEKTTRIEPHQGVRVLMVYTVPMFALGLCGIIVFWGNERTFFWLAVLVITYFVVISAGAEAYSRFRVPVVPIYVILSATGLDAGTRRLQKNRGIGKLTSGAAGC